MRNRISKRQKQIGLCILGCIFAAGLFPGVQGAGLSYQVMAEGDWIAVSGDLSWTAGTSDLNQVPPLNCGGEVLQGGHSTRVLSWGGTYEAQGVLDATDTMIFQQTTQATSLNGIYSDGMFVYGVGSTWEEGVCGPLPDESSDEGFPAYCSGAQVSSLAMGRSLNIQSEGQILQGDIEVLDSMAARIRITGDGIGVIEMRSINLAGIGNTTGLGYENSMRQKVMSSGSPFGVGAAFQWESFAGLWSEPAGETPAETG